MTSAQATARSINNLSNIRLGASQILQVESPRARYRNWRHTVRSHINRMIGVDEKFNPDQVIRQYSTVGRKLIHDYQEGRSALEVAASLVNYYRWKH